MKFENRAPDESVNYSIEHPLKEFAWLAGGVLGTLFIATLLIGYFAGELAAHLPYRYEQSLANKLSLEFNDKPHDAQAAATEAALNQLAARLTAHMSLPEGMQVRVHYAAVPEVNAFATVGANIVIFQGLLARLPDENALAMVLAHEIAHAALRHPARSLGRGVAVGIILSTVSSGMGHNAASGALNTTGGLTMLKFSRDQEREADAAALAAVAALYGHVGGAQELFRVLREAGGGNEALRVSMLSTHPLSQERIDTIASLATEKGWQLEGTRSPLSATLKVTKPGN